MVDHSIVVLDNVRVRQVSENVDFSDQLLFLSTGHVGVVHFFPDKGFIIG